MHKFNLIVINTFSKTHYILKIYFQYTDAKLSQCVASVLNKCNVLSFICLADTNFTAEGGDRVTFKLLSYYIECVIKVIIPVDS